jgi:hypothetical protein
VAKPNVVGLGFFLAAGLFVGVAIYGAVRGRLNAAFLALGVVFFVLALASRRKGSGPPGSAGA